MKRNRKILWMAVALTGLVLAGWSGYKVWWRGSLDIQPVRIAWPETETAIDTLGLKMRVPAPFEPAMVGGWLFQPGEDDPFLLFEDLTLANPAQARRKMEVILAHAGKEYGASSRDIMVAWPSPDGPRERPGVLLVYYRPYGSDQEWLTATVHMVWDRRFLTFSHLGPNEPLGSRTAERTRREEEWLLEKTGLFLSRLERGGRLDTAALLSPTGGAPFEISLYSAYFHLPEQTCHGPDGPRSCGLSLQLASSPGGRFKPRDYFVEMAIPWYYVNAPREKRSPLEAGGRPGREILLLGETKTGPDLRFIWEEDPPDRADYFWRLGGYIGEADRAPEWLGLWRQILETLRLPEDRLGRGE